MAEQNLNPEKPLASKQVVSCSIPKRHNHSHFWIEDGILYESYNTIRGMRFMSMMEVGDITDTDKVDGYLEQYIAKEYYS